jgi:hypothetical protein
MRKTALFLLLVGSAIAQTVAPAAPTIPTYFSETGVRYSYYDKTETETTSIGIRVTGSTVPETPAGLWTTFSVDATPRSQASSAAFRVGARYFLKAAAGGNLILYTNVAAGATTSTTAAVSAATSGNVSSSLLGNLQGGMGFVWRACHTFDKASKVNCVVDLDWELNAVSSQAVKPIVGLYAGLTF